MNRIKAAAVEPVTGTVQVSNPASAFSPGLTTAPAFRGRSHSGRDFR
jgi:hypothetical protein